MSRGRATASPFARVYPADQDSDPGIKDDTDPNKDDQEGLQLI